MINNNDSNSSKIKFVHMADLHLGAFREKKLTDLNFKTFELAISKVLDIKPEFVLFAGDIFNNAMPPIELVSKVVVELMKLKSAGIPLFVIGGSHDYSNSGKSFLQLLEIACVFVDVSKPKFVDDGTVELYLHRCGRVVISGILGKKCGLDKNIYANLQKKDILSKDDFNIFMFHTTLNDFKPDFMKMVKTEVTKSYLPTGFDYYAGGHIHTFMEGSYSFGKLSYPGPLFPNNFSELKREKPCFNLCTFDFETRDTKIDRIFLSTYKKEHVKIEVIEKNPIDLKLMIEEKLSGIDLIGKILLLEVSGVVDGKISDVQINKIISKLYDNGVHIVLKNTYKLTSKDLVAIDVDSTLDSKKLEEEIIMKSFDDEVDYQVLKPFIDNLLSLDLSKNEEEKNVQFEERVSLAIKNSLEKLV
ncbi:MAG: exonuclease SbcCD subunit D [Nanoarchaeales archaeon]|nr:exonuclease SbcCD subunit D [Nanoarchaeales archaeon]